jgi:hypothetical protein
MKKNYKIQVEVKFIETDEAITTDVSNQGDCLELVIDGASAESIDDCEQALLLVNSQALRQALSSHLTEVTKKNTRREQT